MGKQEGDMNLDQAIEAQREAMQAIAMRQDTRAWKAQVWISFLVAASGMTNEQPAARQVNSSCMKTSKVGSVKLRTFSPSGP